LTETQRTLPDKAGPGVTDERWINLRFQEAFAWRALRLSAKLPNRNHPTPRVPEHQATGQETAQRTSAATPADISGSHVTIAARSSLGTAGASRTSSIRVKPGGTFVFVPKRSRHFRVTPRDKGVMSTYRWHGDALLAGRSRRRTKVTAMPDHRRCGTALRLS